ncbi:recombinase RecT [Pseudochelatococcus sp. B33]
MNAVTTIEKQTPVDAYRAQVLPPEKLHTLGLPRHVSPERFERNLANALMQNPDLLKCDPRLTFREVSKAAALGLLLDPQLGEAYLILGWNGKAGRQEPQLRVGYRGLMKLARQSGEVKNLYAHEVNLNDDFSCTLGDHKSLHHKPDVFGDRGPIVGYYAVVLFSDGSSDFEPMSVADIHKIRDRSDAWKAFTAGKIKSTPWSTDDTEMSKKTVLRRLIKRLPQSPELADAIRIEDEAESVVEARPVAVSAPPPPPPLPSTPEPAVIEHQPGPGVAPADFVADGSIADSRAVVTIDAEIDNPAPAVAETVDQVDVAADSVADTVSPDEILAEAIDHMARCRTSDEIETIYAESDWEAELSGADGFVEKLREAKEQHLARVTKIAAAQAAQKETTKKPPAPPADPAPQASLPPPADAGPEKIAPDGEVKAYFDAFLRRCADARTIQDVVAIKAHWDETSVWRFEVNVPGNMISAMKRAYTAARTRAENPEG